MSLVANYSSDGSSSDEESSNMKRPISKVNQEPRGNSSVLPPANLLFQSDSSKINHPKRARITSDNLKFCTNKKLIPKKKEPKGPQLFTPPQLKKPNISTEDHSLWNTDENNRMYKKKQQ